VDQYAGMAKSLRIILEVHDENLYQAVMSF